MTATAAQVRQIRRMTAEVDNDTYSDEDMADYIEAQALPDSTGLEPDDTGWTATYSLEMAAAHIWEEKAAALSGGYDFSADGGEYTRSQAYEQAVRMAKMYRARRRSGTLTLRAEPPPMTPLTPAWVANAAEVDE